MVHNGIEYGMMAAIAEGLSIIKGADIGLQENATHDAENTPLRDPEAYQYDINVGDVAEVWRRGSVVSSWLIDLTAAALAKSPNLDEFGGRVSDSGEGRWTVEAAIDEGVPAPVITASLFQRFESRDLGVFTGKILSALRSEFGGHAEQKAEAEHSEHPLRAGRACPARRPLAAARARQARPARDRAVRRDRGPGQAQAAARAAPPVPRRAAARAVPRSSAPRRRSSRCRTRTSAAPREAACNQFGNCKPDESWDSFAARLSFGAASPEDPSALVTAVEAAEKAISDGSATGGTGTGPHRAAVPPGGAARRRSARW